MMPLSRTPYDVLNVNDSAIIAIIVSHKIPVFAEAPRVMTLRNLSVPANPGA